MICSNIRPDGRAADTLRADGKLPEAMAAYEQVLAKFPLADVAAPPPAAVLLRPLHHADRARIR